MKNRWVPIAIIASIGLFLAAIAIGVAFYQTKKPQKTVSIVGLGERFHFRPYRVGVRLFGQGSGYETGLHQTEGAE